MYQVHNEKSILWTRAHSDSPREKERFLSDKVFICCILCQVDVYFKEWIYSDIKKLRLKRYFSCRTVLCFISIIMTEMICLM